MTGIRRIYVMNSYNELIEEIKGKGFNIESIDDLINMTKREKELVPIILKYIKLFEDEEDKSWLVRTLGVKGFKEATETLIDEFYKASNDSSLKWTIGNTLSIILDKNHIADMIKIVKERGHGTSRQMFVIALGKMKDKMIMLVTVLSASVCHRACPINLMIKRQICTQIKKG